jgi:S1-C subfamily serine protease
MGLPGDEKGLVVASVDPEGKGASAGIQRGDLIKEINRQKIQTVEDYKDQLERADSGEDLNILIKRARMGLLLVKVPA